VVSGHDLAEAIAREEGLAREEAIAREEERAGQTSGPDAAADTDVDGVGTGALWPAVLRPCVGSDVFASDRGGAAPVPHEPSSRLVAIALRAAAGAPVRAVHWFLHPDSTVIAESAYGPRQSVILVGRVPHVQDPAIAAGPIVNPGLLLLGTGATSDACARLAELTGQAQRAPTTQQVAATAAVATATTGSVHGAPAPAGPATSATAVLTRWVLPAECPPLPARLVTDLRADRLQRALITDLAAALARVQMSGDSSHSEARA